MVAVPLVWRTSPSSIRSVVVLPAPFGPRNPVIRPGSTVKLRSSTAVRLPNFLVSRSTTMVPEPMAPSSVACVMGLLPVRDPANQTQGAA